MKKYLFIISFLIFGSSSIGYAGINVDSLIQASRKSKDTTKTVKKEMNNNDEVTYPPKPPETSMEEVVAAGEGVVKESTELGTAVVKGVKDDGGIIATIKHHKKFYGSIFIFFVLLMCWFGGRK